MSSRKWRGTRAAVVITAGFGELGHHGRALQQAALDAASCIRCGSWVRTASASWCPASGSMRHFLHVAAPAGDIAFVSQSGALITAMLDWAAPRGIGFSHVVLLGDMADVDFGDMLDYLAADQQTRAILLYVGITHGRKFMSGAAWAALRLKPVLVSKAVLSMRRACRRLSYRRSGGCRCRLTLPRPPRRTSRVATMAELFDAAETLALTREQVGERLAILTNGGGGGDERRMMLRRRGRPIGALVGRNHRRVEPRLARDVEPRKPG